MLGALLTLTFILSVFSNSNALFTEDFANFLEDNYGEKFKNLLQRKDLGVKGSFGGRGSAEEEIQRDPVVFVHGVSDIAGDKMKDLANKFVSSGYKEGELYATTYFDGSKGNPIQWTQYAMRCDYVKQVRALLLATRYYTNRNIDVVAFSLGVPIARKAILGGFCVDTDEDLGGPLTKYVDAFVGIAGPNHGISLKLAGVTVPTCILGAPPICDRIVGLYSGICPIESMFLNDIHRLQHYEAKHVYSVFTQNDQLIGYRVCDKITASIPGEDGHKSYLNLGHDQLLTHSIDVLLNIVQNHTTDSFPRRSDSVEETPILPKEKVVDPTAGILSETKSVPGMDNIRTFFRNERFEQSKRTDESSHSSNPIPKQSPISRRQPNRNDQAPDITVHDLRSSKHSPQKFMPFMESTQTSEDGLYHTRIHLKLNT